MVLCNIMSFMCFFMCSFIDDASSLLAGALTDPDATGSITMTDESGSQPANGAQSLSVSSALLAFTAVASVLVL